MSGGLLKDASVPSYVKERCHHVLKRYRANDYIIFSSIFSLNVPQKIMSDGYVQSEAYNSCQYLLSISNIDHRKLFLEHSSYDTIGSVYFSLSMIEDLELDVCKIIFVTSSFHLRRVKIIVELLKNFQNIDVEVCVEAPLIENEVKNKWRETHEEEQIEKIYEVFSNLTNKRQFVRWLYLDHDNYSTAFKSKAILEDMLY